ncbi:wnt related [Schistosoma mansoni]|uniref:wnt related n=1 Tax=Schistosoma mansoni TaxID=6183 RepID=UPI00022C83A5|nr:wnt related [Schistosoma mansoni]|eukprot:XP_018646410.1 wnt related [Schistosoma mansoni]
MLSHLKKLNSPLYMPVKHINHITNPFEHHHLMNPSNVLNSSGRKLIRASTSSESQDHLLSNQNELNQLDNHSQVPIQSFPSNDIDLSNHEISICHTLSGLTNRQRYICLQHTGLIWAMLEGTHLGMHECVHQFKHEQWNCSAVNLLYRTHIKSSSLSLTHGLEGILQRGSRETAFLSSSWSAGVVQAITRACSRGQLGTCDCDPHRREGQGRDAEGIFTWGGCSDPIRFGMRLARLFLDANDEEHPRTLMNLHNKKAGRRLIWKNRITKCKCHGVSGACSMRTCWQRVNEFRLIGMMLKAAYDSAIHVTYEPRIDQLKRISNRINSNQNNNYMTRRNLPVVSPNRNHDSRNCSKDDWNDYSNNGRLQRRWPRTVMTKSKEIPKNQLVYLEESPNYCFFDETIGHLGIAGRQCNATSKDAINSCSRLCCDSGYDTLELEREQKCECKFFW